MIDPSQLMGRRITLRCFIPVLCGIYFITIYIFHGRLQYEMSIDNDKRLANAYIYSKNGFLDNGKVVFQNDLQRKVLQSAQNYDNISDREKLERSDKEKLLKDKQKIKTKNYSTCFIPANYSKRLFTRIEDTFYVYSAYLDERYGNRVVRLMSVLALEKKERTLELFCHFAANGTATTVKAKMYELCENHGKKFGGFIFSCDVPSVVLDVCSVNVSIKIRPLRQLYQVPETRTITVPVTKLVQEPLKFNYTICVPPLFGDINAYRFIEFIELNRIFGVQHFIFYNYNIQNQKILKLLDFYSNHALVTLIDWKLPSKILKNHIWYNGQLSAHNDCLYRGMSLTKYLAVIDIDEYIVPHNSKRTFHESFEALFSPSTCGLSFDSAFYDPKFSNRTARRSTNLVTVGQTGRTRMFSKVRTKVMVQPRKIFEVGIHHISKPADEAYKVLRVNTSVAYLHHYRTCVPNYGMKCAESVVDRSLMVLNDQLKNSVNKIWSNVLDKSAEL